MNRTNRSSKDILTKHAWCMILLCFFASCATKPLDQYQAHRNRVPVSGIDLPAISNIKPRKAAEIEASMLGVGCEVLCRGYAYYDGYKEYLGNLGVKHARFQSGWAKTEKEVGYYDFTWLDPIINDCISRGIQPWMNISYGNALYAGGGDATIRSPMPHSEEALQAWDAYVENLVNHYKTRIFEWEIWNEPNNHHDRKTGPITYADFVIRTAEIIRKVQPEGKTIVLAIGYYANTWVQAFFDHLKSKGKVHLVDIVSMHGYPKNPDDARLDALIELVKQYDPRIAFLQGEAGAPSSKSTGALADTDFTELVQAKWNLRRALVHLGRNIPHSQFAISDMKYPSWRERGMNTKGLLKMNEEDKCIAYPKQSYFAYQYLTSLFDSTVTASKDFTAEVRADAASSCYTFMDKLNNTPLITYWKSARPPDNGTTMERAELKLNGIRLQSPVLVDIRTGTVHQIPEAAIKRTNTSLEFALPIYDSPLLLCDASFLHSRRILRN